MDFDVFGSKRHLSWKQTPRFENKHTPGVWDWLNAASVAIDLLLGCRRKQLAKFRIEPSPLLFWHCG